MKDFLQAVNACSGVVNLLYSGERMVNINKQYKIQNELLQQYYENKKYLQLILDIPNSKDYMNIVSYYAGDC